MAIEYDIGIWRFLGGTFNLEGHHALITALYMFKITEDTSKTLANFFKPRFNELLKIRMKMVQNVLP